MSKRKIGPIDTHLDYILDRSKGKNFKLWNINFATQKKEIPRNGANVNSITGENLKIQRMERKKKINSVIVVGVQVTVYVDCQPEQFIQTAS